MQNLLCFILNGSRLLISHRHSKSIIVFDTKNQSVLCKIAGQVIGLSDDGTHLLVEGQKQHVSVWNVINGIEVEITIDLISTFSQNQRLRVSKGFSELILQDVFTKGIVDQISTPQIGDNTFDSFDSFRYKSPDQRFLFQSTFVDTGWGESYYLWCYDIELKKWIFNAFYSINDKPSVFIAPQHNLAVVATFLFICGYDLIHGTEVFRHQLPNLLKPVAFDLTTANSALLAIDDKIAKMDLKAGKIIKILDHAGVLALAISPHGFNYYVLSEVDGLLSLTIRQITSNEIQHKITIK